MSKHLFSLIDSGDIPFRFCIYYTKCISVLIFKLLHILLEVLLTLQHRAKWNLQKFTIFLLQMLHCYSYVIPFSENKLPPVLNLYADLVIRTNPVRLIQDSARLIRLLWAEVTKRKKNIYYLTQYSISLEEWCYYCISQWTRPLAASSYFMSVCLPSCILTSPYGKCMFSVSFVAYSMKLSCVLIWTQIPLM